MPRILAFVVLAAVAAAVWLLPSGAARPVAPGDSGEGYANTEAQNHRSRATENGASTQLDSAQRSPATLAAPGKALTGRMTYVTGNACKGDVVARAAPASTAADDGPAVRAATDAEGQFTLEIPAHWRRVCIEARDARGARGQVDVEWSEHDSKKQPIPDILMSRPVELRLSIETDPGVLQAIPPGSLRGSVTARVEQWPARLFGPGRVAPKLSEAFSLRDGLQQSKTWVVDCAEFDRITWIYAVDTGLPNSCHHQDVPPGVTSVDAVLSLELGMLLIVTAIDRAGRPVPDLPFFAWSDVEPRRIACLTDDSGHCVRIVRKGDFGRLELPWQLVPWQSGDGKWQEANEPWSTGTARNIEVDANEILKIRVVDEAGQAVERFRLRFCNDSERGDDGRPLEPETSEYVHGTLQYFASKRIARGSTAFIARPGLGEFAVPIDEDLVPRRLPHTLKMGPRRIADVRFDISLRNDLPEAGFVTVDMRTVEASKTPAAYSVRRTFAGRRAEFTLHDLLPGTYRVVTTAIGQSVGASHPVGDLLVVLAEGAVSEVLVR
jgi:hypothetical protein